MKKLYFPLMMIIVTTFFVMTSCNTEDKNNKENISDTITVDVNESEILLDFLEKSGNYMNNKEMPFIIEPDDVFANINKFHIIDIRKPKDYTKGHIDGAVNIGWNDMMDYMKNKIIAANYEKIVFVCYSNHTASYATMMFRLLGYANTYSMKWGMSACDKETLEKKWQKNISNEFANMIETKGNKKAEKGNYPKINTGKKTGYEILEVRVAELLKKHDFKVKAKKVFEEPNKYYIINYWTPENYAKGHIPEAVQYTPKKSLTSNTYLKTLPADKPIAIYCFTGQHGSYIAAYLQVLGYNAYNISYGANGFMHDKLISDEIGKSYNKEKHFKVQTLVSGDKPKSEKQETTLKK